MNWKAGDIALCVKGGSLGQEEIPGGYPMAGALYEVKKVKIGTFQLNKKLQALVMPDAPPNLRQTHTWPAARFVKVTPGEDIEGREVEKKVSIADRHRKERRDVLVKETS